MQQPRAARDDVGGPGLTGVIVTYRSTTTIRAALDASRPCVLRGLMELVVVDNASPDATPALLREHAGFARIVFGTHNVGFGRGCNRGLAEVTSPYVVFINPDGQLGAEAVEAIVAFMDAHPRCAIAGPVIEKDDHTFWHVGGLATPWTIMGDALGLHTSFKKRRHVKPGDPAFQTDWVSGAMLIGRVSMLRELGGFDPRFFLYWEETDLCRRAMAKGWEIWCIPSAHASHIGGVSAAEEERDSAGRVKGCIASHFYESRYYYLRKQFGGFAALGADLVEFFAMPFVTLARKLLGKHTGPAFARWKHPLWKLPRRAEEVGPL